MVQIFTCRTPYGAKSKNRHTSSFRPTQTYLAIHIWLLFEKETEYKLQQKRRYDLQHRVKDQEPLDIDVPAWLTSEHAPVPGQIQDSSNHPRSYIVSTPTGLMRHNRQHLNQRTDGRDQSPPEPVSTAVPPNEFIIIIIIII